MENYYDNYLNFHDLLTRRTPIPRLGDDTDITMDKTEEIAREDVRLENSLKTRAEFTMELERRLRS